MVIPRCSRSDGVSLFQCLMEKPTTGIATLFCFEEWQAIVRPPLSKKLFPVSWVGKKKASGESFFLFLNFIFYKLECTEGGGGEREVKSCFFLK